MNMLNMRVRGSTYDRDNSNSSTVDENKPKARQYVPQICASARDGKSSRNVMSEVKFARKKLTSQKVTERARNRNLIGEQNAESILDQTAIGTPV